jgi:hypothetical protein
MPFSPMLRQSLIGRLDSADCVLGKLNAFDTSHAAALQSLLKRLRPSRFGSFAWCILATSCFLAFAKDSV